jgi:hypothetical protein
MSQRAVERALGKLLTDEAFRETFFRAPGAACVEAGLELSAEELEALRRLSCSALGELSATIDDRIRRLRVGPGGGGHG